MDEYPAVLVVQASVDAYNAHDVEAFVACLAADARIGSEPHVRVGKEAAAEMYRDLFERVPQLQVTLLARMAHGQYVIDKEYITGDGEPFVAISINRVVDGKIVSMSFLYDET